MRAEEVRVAVGERLGFAGLAVTNQSACRRGVSIAIRRKCVVHFAANASMERN